MDLLDTEQRVLVEDIDGGDLATTVCSTCLVAIAELDGIWYHIETHGLAQHLARPPITLQNGSRR